MHPINLFNTSLFTFYHTYLSVNTVGGTSVLIIVQVKLNEYNLVYIVTLLMFTD